MCGRWGDRCQWMRFGRYDRGLARSPKVVQRRARVRTVHPVACNDGHAEHSQGFGWKDWENWKRGCGNGARGIRGSVSGGQGDSAGRARVWGWGLSGGRGGVASLTRELLWLWGKCGGGNWCEGGTEGGDEGLCENVRAFFGEEGDWGTREFGEGG